MERCENVCFSVRQNVEKENQWKHNDQLRN